MVLAADIGNSTIALGCFEGSEIRFVERIATNRHSSALEYAMLIKTVLELNGLSGCTFEGSIISSVVPSITNMLSAAMERLTGKKPLIVGPGLKTGLEIRTENPAQLGSDRVTDAVAAIHHYPCPLILIDMGTATTISVVDEKKQFLGGMIMPGLRISMEALAAKTSQLPQISLDPPKQAIGRNTVDCMKSGVIFGCAATIDGAIDRIEAELGQPCTEVSTGGHAGIVIPYCKHRIVLDDQLLLKGLMILYRKNQG